MARFWAVRQATWLVFLIVPAALTSSETPTPRSDDVNVEFSIVPKFSVNRGKLRTFDGIWDPPICARKCNKIPSCNAFMLSPAKGQCVLVRSRLQEYNDAFRYYEKHLDEVEKGEDQGKARKQFMAEMEKHLDPNKGAFDAELAARDAALRRAERDRKLAIKILEDANKHSEEAAQIASEMTSDNAKALQKFFRKISSRRVRDRDDMIDRDEAQGRRPSALSELQDAHAALALKSKVWEHKRSLKVFQAAAIQSAAAVVDDAYLEDRIGVRAESEGVKRVVAAKRRLKVANKAYATITAQGDKIMRGAKMRLAETIKSGESRILALKVKSKRILDQLQKKLTAADARVMTSSATMKRLRQERVSLPAQAETDGQADIKEAEGRQDLAFAAVEAATDRAALGDQRMRANQTAAHLRVVRIDNSTAIAATEIKRNTSYDVDGIERTTSGFRNLTGNQTEVKQDVIYKVASVEAERTSARAEHFEQETSKVSKVAGVTQEAVAVEFQMKLQMKESEAQVELRLRDTELHQARAQSSLQLELNAGKAERRATWFLRQDKAKLMANYTNLMRRQKKAEQQAEYLAEKTAEPNQSDEEKRALLMGAGDQAIEGRRLRVEAEVLWEQIAQLENIVAHKAVVAVRKVQQQSKLEQQHAEQARAAEASSASAAVAEVAHMKHALQDLMQKAAPEAPDQNQIQSNQYHLASTPPTDLPQNFSELLKERLIPNVQTATRKVAQWGKEVGNITAITQRIGNPGSTYLTTWNQIFCVRGGKVVHVAGGGMQPGFADGLAESARFKEITGISVAQSAKGDILYVADKGNHAIRRVAGGLVSTVAGGGRNTSIRCSECDQPSNAVGTVANATLTNDLAGTGHLFGCCSGQGIVLGLANGDAAEALFHNPTDVSLLVDGSVEHAYVADQHNHALRHIWSSSGRDGVVQTLAGNGSGFQDGLLHQSKMQSPSAVAAVVLDNNTHRVFVADTGNRAVRMMDVALESTAQVGRQPARQLLKVGDVKVFQKRRIAQGWANKLATAKKFRASLPMLNDEISTEAKQLHGLKASIKHVRARQVIERMRLHKAALAALAAPPVLEEKVLHVEEFKLSQPTVAPAVATGPRYTTGAVGPAAADKRCQFPFVSSGLTSEADCSHDWTMFAQPVTASINGWCVVGGSSMLFDPATSQWGACHPAGYAPAPVVCELSSWSDWSTPCDCERRAFVRSRVVKTGECKEHLEEEKSCFCHLLTTIIAPAPHSNATVISRHDWGASKLSAVDGEQRGDQVVFVGGEVGGATRVVVGGKPSNFKLHVDTVDVPGASLFTAAGPWKLLIQSAQGLNTEATMGSPEVRCEFSSGNGAGGTQLSLGSAASAASCAALVQSQEPTANAVSYSSTGDTDCVARYEMSSISNDKDAWETCYLVHTEEKGPGDGGLETLAQMNLWMTLPCDDAILSELRRAWPSEHSNSTANTVQRTVPLTLQLKRSVFEVVAVHRLRQVEVYGLPNWAATVSKHVLCSKHKDEMLQQSVQQNCCDSRDLHWSQTVGNSVWRPTKANLAHVIESEL